VVENISGSKKAGTSASRDSSYDVAIDNVLGNPLNFGLTNLWGHGNTLSPTVKAAGKSDFTGDGETSQEGNLVGTITAKVVEVQPNGNLVIESRKEITLNNETQILVLRGIIRTDDVSFENTIPSTRVADAKLFFVGKGVLSEKQSPGWLARVLDRVWPF
jgi:flagellar L-ring protein precursor FlgH